MNIENESPKLRRSYRFLVEIAGRYGYVDHTGAMAILPLYESARDFSEGLAWVKTKGGPGYINTLGQLVIKLPSDSPKIDFSDGMAMVKMNGKFGYIDKTGKVAVKPQFQYAQDFSEGLAPVAVDGLWGFINKAGAMVIQPQFDFAREFSESLAAVRIMNGKWGYIDKTGKMVIQAQFSDAFSFCEDRAQVNISSGQYCSNGLTVNTETKAFINKSGEVEIIPQALFANSSSENQNQVNIEQHGEIPFVSGGVRKLDNKGRLIIQPKYVITHDFYEGLANIFIDGRYRYIDKSGKEAFQLQLRSASSFSEGLATVQVNSGKYGFVDKTGTMVIPPLFEEAGWFIDGLARVKFAGQDGYIDKMGKLIWPKSMVVNTATVLDTDDSDRIIIEAKGMYGYINNKGELVIPPIFGEAAPFCEGLARVKVDERYGYIDKTGTMIVWPQFETAEDFHNGYANVTTDSIKGTIDLFGKWSKTKKRWFLFARRIWKKIRNRKPSIVTNKESKRIRIINNYIYNPIGAVNLVLTHKAIEDVPAQQIVIGRDFTTIGRNPRFGGGISKCDVSHVEVKTTDMSMAKKHCIIRRIDETKFSIEEYADSDSFGRPVMGTWLNGKEISGPTLLKEGDVIRFGPRIEFTVRFCRFFGRI